MATTLENGVRTLSIKFGSGSMTVSKIKESCTKAQVKAFVQAIGLFTTKTIASFTINDKETTAIED